MHEDALFLRLPQCVSGLSLAYTHPEDEAAFLKHLAPEVVFWTAVGHFAAWAIHLLIIGGNVLGQAMVSDDSFAWDADDPRSAYFNLDLFVLGVQTLVCLAIGAIRAFGQSERLCSELVSVLSTGLISATIPWLGAWHEDVMTEHNPLEVWTGSAEEHDSLRIIAIIAVTLTHISYVPTRWFYGLMLPVLNVTSFVLLVSTCGSSSPSTVGFKVTSLFFLLVVLIPAARYREQLFRQVWWALRRVEEQKSEMNGVQSEMDSVKALSGALCDIVCTLSETFAFLGDNASRDAFFEGKVVGRRFTDFLSSADKQQFQGLVKRMSESDGPVSAPVSVLTSSGGSDVELFVVNVRHAHEATTGVFYIMGIKLCNDGLTLVPEEAEAPPVAWPLMFGIVPSLVAERCERACPDGPSSFVGGETPAAYSVQGPAQLSFESIRKAWDDPVSFAISESTVGRVSHMDDDLLSELLGEAKSPGMSDAFAQTEIIVFADASVNTSVVGTGLGFRGRACEKPPKLPGFRQTPLHAHKPSKKKHPRLSDTRSITEPSSSNSASTCSAAPNLSGPELDGVWRIDITVEGDVSDWLRRIEIRGMHAVLGDGAMVALAVRDGDVCLCGGALSLHDNVLHRMGKSGQSLRFHRTSWASDDDDGGNETDAESIASFADTFGEQENTLPFQGNSCRRAER
mmetsp:Transcript_52160/g.169428  ORF Transcript_52160/g.169428 Transcript_52160/m.169428 type:complete len:682 (+) Transcript_52160:80-2125(+)